MTKKWIALLPLLACAAFAGGSIAMSGPPTPSVDNRNTIDGIAIMPGVERLSYISPRYYGIRSAYDACVKEAQGRVPDRGDCADAEFKYQDDRLNHAYKTLVAGLSGIDKQSAIDAQRAWLGFLSQDCSARANRFGSNDAPATESICRMESTALRAQQLEDWHASLAGH